SAELSERTCCPAVGARIARKRESLECRAVVRVTAKHADGLKAHHRLATTLIEAAPDSSVDVCLGRVPVADQRVLDIVLVVRVAARKSEVERSEERRVGKECRCGWGRYQ